MNILNINILEESIDEIEEHDDLRTINDNELNKIN